MSKPTSLQDLYIDELKDLWSANDQMQRVVKKIADKANSLGGRGCGAGSAPGCAARNPRRLGRSAP